jgi:hypothetical protein
MVHEAEGDAIAASVAAVLYPHASSKKRLFTDLTAILKNSASRKRFGKSRFCSSAGCLVVMIGTLKKSRKQQARSFDNGVLILSVCHERDDGAMHG